MRGVLIKNAHRPPEGRGFGGKNVLTITIETNLNKFPKVKNLKRVAFWINCGR